METNNFYQIEDEGSVELSLEKTIEEAPDARQSKLTDVLRIEEDVARRFSGVRGCSDSATHNSNALQALEEWAKAKIFEHRDLRYIRYSYLSGSARWTNYTSWDGTRSCSGSVTIRCFIEFRKP
jgi:hypothetical protein